MGRFVFLGFIGIIVSLYGEELYYYAGGKKVYIQEVASGKYPAAAKSVRFFKDEKGAELGVGEGILVKLKKGERIEPLLERYDLLLIREMTHGLYLVAVKDMQRVFETANRLYEDNATLYAHPDFIKKINLR